MTLHFRLEWFNHLWIQCRCQSLASRGGGGKESFRGHIASNILGKTLATAPPRWGAIFIVGARPPGSPAAPTLYGFKGDEHHAYAPMGHGTVYLSYIHIHSSSQ